MTYDDRGFVLPFLEQNLGVLNPSEDKKKYLLFLIQTARERIMEEGITLNAECASDAALVVSYAAYLYRKRAETLNAMPRDLRYALNNRLMHEKGSSDAV